MGLKYRNRVTLFPGAIINLSRSGISTTLGIPGLSVNLNKQGAFLNTGIPGTGIYDRIRLGGGKKNESNSNIPRPRERNALDVGDMYVHNSEGNIRTENSESTTTEGLKELRHILYECYEEKIQLKNDIQYARLNLLLASALLIVSYLLVVGFFISWFRDYQLEKKEFLDDLIRLYNQCSINIDIDTDASIENAFSVLRDKYLSLVSSNQIWDITSSVENDRVATRSAASSVVTRRKVKFGFESIDIIKSKYEALHFENANGGDIYLYPPFVAMVDEKKKFGLIDLREFQFSFKSTLFVESQSIPTDAQIVDYTWAKVNKNGSPDKRFKDNYKIPICRYGELTMRSKTGMNEAYHFSSYDKAKLFADAMQHYLSLIK